MHVRSSRLRLLAAAALVLLPAVTADAAEVVRAHGLSLLGQPEYAPGFKNFNWVNPNAPKGGSVHEWAPGSFDSLNEFPFKGIPPAGISLIHAYLLKQSPDEPATAYGVIAEWASHPADFSSVTFGLRASARFHDGRPITPEDVIFTIKELKAKSPNYAQYFKNIAGAEKTGEREVTVRFDVKNNREMPQIAGEIPVLPKHWWEAKGANGQPRDLANSSLEIPLGSGPYRVKAVDAGRAITYERVKDWWAADLPVMRGQYNFDEIQYTYYRDKTPAFEEFKTGQIDFWDERNAKDWATRYDFDAVKRGFIKLEKIPIKTVAPMQALVLNQRRKQFQDARVRRALNLAFNFEMTNKNLLNNEYTRVASYFDNSEFAAKGLPEGRELALLGEVRGEIPPEVFTTEWKNPVNDTPEQVRANLGQAAKLLGEAGWVAKGGVLANAAGEPLAVEILLAQPDLERIVLPWKVTLERLGVKAQIRLVDSAQYIRRRESFDFDVIVTSYQQSQSPGNEQREFWSSEAAAREGSRNTTGIKNPAIDKLVERVVFATDRAELGAATRALDRVLLWNHYVVPLYYAPFERVATWDLFSRPAKLPSQAVSFLTVWWYDAEKAKKLEEARAKR